MKKLIIILSFIALFMASAIAAGIIYPLYASEQSYSTSLFKNNQKKSIKLENSNNATIKNKDTVNNENKLTDNSKDNATNNENKLTTNINKNDKVVYLTFDDGPSYNVTPQILDTLKKNNVKATFFVLGKMCKKNPDMLKKINSEGHYIANHTYSHNYKYLYSSKENFISDIKKCDDTIISILGAEHKTKLVRFPGGAFTKKTIPYKKELKDLGYNYINWDSSIADSAYANVPTDKLVKNAIRYSGGMKKVVLLMHDSEAKNTTAKALPKIIEYFKSNGYKFDTLEDYEF